MPASMLPLILLSTVEDPLTAAQANILQYGVLGIINLALAWFAWSSILRERRRADEFQARYLAQSDLVRDQVVPALVHATDATTKCNEVTGRLTDMLPDLLAALAAIRQRRQ